MTLVAVLVAATACSGAADDRSRADPSTRASSTTSSTPSSQRASPQPTSSPSAKAPASPSAGTTVAPSASPSAGPTARRPRARPARDTVGSATAAQLVGLVRVVASIGYDGRGETSTGMLLTPRGEVLTNAHGVAGATAVRATVMSTGRTYVAHVEDADARHDVAVLRLDGASGLDPVRLATRDARVGDRVTAVGDAGGRRSGFTAATGTVVALNRTLVTPRTATARAERLTGVLVDTADVAAGESGGPMYSSDGRVVGLTTAVVRLRGEAYGVAIPVATVRTVLASLRRG